LLTLLCSDHQVSSLGRILTERPEALAVLRQYIGELLEGEVGSNETPIAQTEPARQEITPTPGWKRRRR
jgi:hypothetical protein